MRTIKFTEPSENETFTFRISFAVDDVQYCPIWYMFSCIFERFAI